MSEKKHTIITTSGREVEVRAVSHVLLEKIGLVVEKEFRERGEQMDIPTYTAELAGGATEEYEHDEESIKDAPEEEKQAWEDHKSALQRLEVEQTARRGLYIFRKGLVVDQDELESGAWIAEQKEFGFEIPTSPDERFMHYVETELLVTPGDQVNAFSQIMRLTMDGTPDELIGGAEEFFRLALARETTLEGIEAKVDTEQGVLDGQQEMD